MSVREEVLPSSPPRWTGSFFVSASRSASEKWIFRSGGEGMPFVSAQGETGEAVRWERDEESGLKNSRVEARSSPVRWRSARIDAAVGWG